MWGVGWWWFVARAGEISLGHHCGAGWGIKSANPSVEWFHACVRGCGALVAWKEAWFVGCSETLLGRECEGSGQVSGTCAPEDMPEARTQEAAPERVPEDGVEWHSFRWFFYLGKKSHDEKRTR